MTAFFFHYNKPASLSRQTPTMSLHYKGVCHLVEEIDCRVATHSRIHARQPRFVMAGKAKKITIRKHKATII